MDPISDMLTIIRNAQGFQKEKVVLPFSNLKFEVAKVLEKEGFLGKIDKRGKKEKKKLEILLKYENGAPAISGLKKISKSGQRIYKSHKDIRKIRGGYGIAIISTSKGLMTDKEARKKRLGGEVIAEIW